MQELKQLIDTRKLRNSRSDVKELTIRANGEWAFTSRVARELGVYEVGDFVRLDIRIDASNCFFLLYESNSGEAFTRKKGHSLSYNNKNLAKEMSKIFGRPLPLKFDVKIYGTGVTCKLK